MAMKVLVADKFEQVGIEGLKALGCEVLYDPAAGPRLAEVVAQTDPEILVVRSSKVPASVMDKATRLKVIVRAGAGVDNIEVPAATSRRIQVCNCPGMNAVAVAELAMGLLICCDRRIPDQCEALRAGKWNKKGFAKGKGLKGMTLGVIGVGAIGQEVIKRAVAFGMDVVAWSRSITPQHAQALNARFGGTTTPDLLEMARTCDAITVHLPAAPSTNKLFGKQFFDAMKPGAYFINTSRGSLVDEAALREAVQSKGLRAGLDVYENQPSEAEAAMDCETARMMGVYTTHHVGASTDQAQLAVAEEVVRIVKVYKEKGKVENSVNP
jgi:D-3-phosphoglycerate dehydrogenase / 2-oxoglutarate reductase